MGMRSSDATFLRREILPILQRTAEISPDAAQALEALSERIESSTWMSDAPPRSSILSWHAYSHDLQSSRLRVDDHDVPYIEARRGTEWAPGAVSLILDDRFGLDTTEDELDRWAPFLADAMAVSAGRTSHGFRSYIRNPHGRSGGGDPPEIIGTPVCTKPGVCDHCTPDCEYDHPHTGACMKLAQRP